MHKRLIAGAAALALTAAVCPDIYTGEAIKASADAALKFSLSSPAAIVLPGESTATAGTETVTVDIQLASNPGAQSWVVLLDYDKSKLTFDSAAAAASFGGIATYDKGGQIVINDFESADVSATGKAVTLTFKVKSGIAAGTYNNSFSLKVSEDAGNFFNYSGKALTAEAVNASAPLTVIANSTGSTGRIVSNVSAFNAPSGTTFDIAVYSGSAKITEIKGAKTGDTVGTAIPYGTYTAEIKCSDKNYAMRKVTVNVNSASVSLSGTLYIYGDLDMNGAVNLYDLGIMQRYLAKWDIHFPYEEVANVDGSTDGKVTLTDLGTLQRYLAKWDISLGRA